MKDRRVAAIVTLGDAATLTTMARECSALARSGAQVRVLFRDESIPHICAEAVRASLVPPAPGADAAHSGEASTESALAELAAAGDVRLYACTSSMYLWGVTGQDLLPSITGGRGLIAFLADDLAGASQILSY